MIYQLNIEFAEKYVDFLGWLDQLSEFRKDDEMKSRAVSYDQLKELGISKSLRYLDEFFDVTGFDKPDTPFYQPRGGDKVMVSQADRTKPWEFDSLNIPNHPETEAFEDILERSTFGYLVERGILVLKMTPWEQLWGIIDDSHAIEGHKRIQSFYTRLLADDVLRETVRELISRIYQDKPIAESVRYALESISDFIVASQKGPWGTTYQSLENYNNSINEAKQ